MNEIDMETYSLDVPGGTLQYDVRGDLKGDAADRTLLLIGFPMDAGGFTTLACLFTDRPVVTYDPRTTGRSGKLGDRMVTPDEHADDLHRLIDALGVGTVDLFGSSGGAINGLALVAKHPEQVRTFVAHEPPLAQVLPDRDNMLAACADIAATYQSRGLGSGMAKFIALVSYDGLLPDDYLAGPAPDPAAFGLPTEDDGSRDDPMLAGSMRTMPHYQPDFAALSRASTRTRLVLAAGKESGSTMAARGAYGVAERLEREVTVFPSNHGGFLGDEYGQPGDPAAFAAALRKVLDAA